MPDVQYVCIQKFAKCVLIFENLIIISKSIILIFIISISIYWSSLKAFVVILMILNGVYDTYFWLHFRNIWQIELNAGEITTTNTN